MEVGGSLGVLRDLFSIIAMVFSAGFGLYTFFAVRRKDVTARLDRHDSRLQTLEQTVASQPSIADMHKIELMMAEMTGSMGRIEAVMEGNAKIMGRLETIVTRHEDHLLSNGK